MDTTLDRRSRIYLAGHTGLVGSAIHRALNEAGFGDGSIITRELDELDLTDQAATRRFFAEERPDVVIDAAAKVGGILANSQQPWEFLELNLLIELNLIGEAFRHGVQRLIFLGSSCIYPREAPQPLREEYLLTGPLEETNRAYAVAKIAGIEMCRSLNRQYGTDYLSLMPTNLYGPGDNFDLETSHVLPALIRKFHDAKVAAGAGGPGGGPAAGPASRCGAPARRCASSCTWTTSGAPSPSASTTCTPRTSPTACSMWAAARTSPSASSPSSCAGWWATRAPWSGTRPSRTGRRASSWT